MKIYDWHDVTEWLTSGRTLKKRESQLKKQEDPTTKKGTVGDFCRTYTVEEAMERFLPGVYTACAVEEDTPRCRQHCGRGNRI